MAQVLEEKKKKFAPRHVNIYAEGTPTVKAQSKMNNTFAGVAEDATNVADKFLGGAGARKIGRGVAKVVKPITNARENQKQFFSNKKETTALANNKTSFAKRGNAEADALLYGEEGKPVAKTFTPPPQIMGHGKTTNVAPQKAGTGMAVAGEVPEGQAQTEEGQPQEAPVNQFTAPPINERPNAQRDTALGKMTSSAAENPDGGTTNTFSAGGGNLSYDMSKQDIAIKESLAAIDAKIAAGDVPTSEEAKRIQELRLKAGFTRGGTDKQEFSNGGSNQASQEAEKRFNFMPPVNPTEEQLKQYDYQEGLKSGRFERPRDPMLGMSEAERIAYRNTQANTANNIRNNETGMAGVESQNAERQSNIDTREFTLNRQKQNDKMLEDISAMPEGPQKDAAIKQYRLSVGQKANNFTTKVVGIYDDQGIKIGEKIVTVDPTTGQESDVQQGGQQQNLPPADVKQRKIGAIYDSKNGPVRWNGKTYDLVE